MNQYFPGERQLAGRVDDGAQLHYSQSAKDVLIIYFKPFDKLIDGIGNFFQQLPDVLKLEKLHLVMPGTDTRAIIFSTN